MQKLIPFILSFILLPIGSSNALATEPTFQGVFDASIYSLPPIPVGFTPEDRDFFLRWHLSLRKKEKINAFFDRKVRELLTHCEGMEILSVSISERIRSAATTGLSAVASTLMGFKGIFMAPAISETAAHVIPKDDIAELRRAAQKEKLREIFVQIEDFKKTRSVLKKMVDSEKDISELERNYILKKASYSMSLQTAIEGMLIDYRNEGGFDKSSKLEKMQKALRMPQQVKSVDCHEALANFAESAYFREFSEGLRDQFKSIILKVCTDSTTHSYEMTKAGRRTSLREAAYFYGPPSVGKSTAARALAHLMGLPFYEVTIKNSRDLSDEYLEGNSGWNSKTGVLVDALLQEGPLGAFQNGFLIINDVDKILFPRGSTEPNTESLAFLQDLLDPLKESFKSRYFDADIPISRLNIIVTSNTPLAGDSLRPLISRVKSVAFESFSAEKLITLCQGYLRLLLEKYPSVHLIEGEADALIQDALSLHRMESGTATIEFRDLQRRLEGLIGCKAAGLPHGKCPPNIQRVFQARDQASRLIQDSYAPKIKGLAYFLHTTLTLPHEADADEIADTEEGLQEAVLALRRERAREVQELRDLASQLPKEGFGDRIAKKILRLQDDASDPAIQLAREALKTTPVSATGPVPPPES